MAVNFLGLVQKQRIIRKPYFVGFNTVGQPAPPYSLTNIDIVKRDIINHFNTPVGSRLMMPTFGTHIFKYLFDPFDDYTKNTIISDAVRVVKTDPRVDLVSIDAFQQEQSLIITMDLNFKPESVTQNMFVTFSLKDAGSF